MPENIYPNSKCVAISLNEKLQMSSSVDWLCYKLTFHIARHQTIKQWNRQENCQSNNDAYSNILAPLLSLFYSYCWRSVWSWLHHIYSSIIRFFPVPITKIKIKSKESLISFHSSAVAICTHKNQQLQSFGNRLNPFRRPGLWLRQINESLFLKWTFGTLRQVISHWFFPLVNFHFLFFFALVLLKKYHLLLILKCCLGLQFLKRSLDNESTPLLPDPLLPLISFIF